MRRTRSERSKDREEQSAGGTRSWKNWEWKEDGVGEQVRKKQ